MFLQKDAHLSINGGPGKEPRPFAFKALPFEIKNEQISYTRAATGRILPKSSYNPSSGSAPEHPAKPHPEHPAKPQNGRGRKGKGKGKGKASPPANHPASRMEYEDHMSFNVIEEEGDHLEDFYDIATLPIIFSAPAKDT
jgi:hypothetical protein